MLWDSRAGCRASHSLTSAHRIESRSHSASPPRRAQGLLGGGGMESSGHAAVVADSLQQAEFLAEDELVEISPMVVSGVVALVCGDFGPFEPSIATAVPLWLALAMKKLRRCRILPPRWLQATEVEKIVQMEREKEEVLQEIPRYFFQVRLCQLCLLFSISSSQKPRCSNVIQSSVDGLRLISPACNRLPRSCCTARRTTWSRLGGYGGQLRISPASAPGSCGAGCRRTCAIGQMRLRLST